MLIRDTKVYQCGPPLLEIHQADRDRAGGGEDVFPVGGLQAHRCGGEYSHHLQQVQFRVDVGQMEQLLR